MTAEAYFPLPLSLEEITPDWLGAALSQRAPGVQVRSAEVVDVMRSTTTKVRLQLELNDAGRAAGIPERVILKGGFEEHSRELHRMHLREVRGYRDVFPEIPLPSPACYFADYDPERRQGIVIMDDLQARGVTFCHALQPQSPEQVARRLGVLARFHAASWDSEALKPGGRWDDIVDFFDVMRDFFDRYSAPDVWRAYIELPRGAATSVRFHDRDWLVRSWDLLTAFARQLPHCLLHGDIHLGNLYIDTDGTPGFFDTLASRGPGMLEVSYHVSAALDSGERRQAEAALVQHYLDELGRAGVRAPPIDEAMRQYGLFLLYGHFIWMTTDAYRQTEAVNTANAARVSAAMLDCDTIGLLDALTATAPADRAAG